MDDLRLSKLWFDLVDKRAEYLGCFADTGTYMPVVAQSTSDQTGILTTQVRTSFLKINVDISGQFLSVSKFQRNQNVL